MKLKIALLTILIITIVTVMGLVSPHSVGLPLYLLVFGLFYVGFFIVILIISDVAYSRTPLRSRLFSAIVLAFTPTIVLALSSLSSLTFIDFILALGLPIVITWYGLRSRLIK